MANRNPVPHTLIHALFARLGKAERVFQHLAWSAHAKKPQTMLRLSGDVFGYRRLLAAGLHVRLQVIGQGHVGDQAVLGFQPVDGGLAMFEQVCQQVAADVVLQFLA